MIVFLLAKLLCLDILDINTISIYVLIFMLIKSLIKFSGFFLCTLMKPCYNVTQILPFEGLPKILYFDETKYKKELGENLSAFPSHNRKVLFMQMITY